MYRKNVVTVVSEEEKEMIRAAEDMTKTAKIRALFDGGMGTKEIGQLLGIRYNHAYNVIQNYVITQGIEIEKRAVGSGTGAGRAEIEKRLKSGMKIIDVARELGKTYNSVWQVANMMKSNQAKDDVLTENHEVDINELIEVEKKKGKKNKAV